MTDVRICEAFGGKTAISPENPNNPSGDQTGLETRVSPWRDNKSNGGWQEVIRCLDEGVAQSAAAAMVKLIQSNKVGYANTGKRNSLYQALEKYDWSVDKFLASGETADADCASFVYTAYCIVFEPLRGWMGSDDNKIRNCIYCGNVWKIFNKYGNFKFKRFQTPEYTAKSDNLKVGDILNYFIYNVVSKDTKGHTVMVCSIDGSVELSKQIPGSSSGTSSTNSYTSDTRVPYVPKDPIDPNKVPKVRSMKMSNKKNKGLILGTHMNQK